MTDRAVNIADKPASPSPTTAKYSIARLANIAASANILPSLLGTQRALSANYRPLERRSRKTLSSLATSR
ncbi:hypothetical protein BAUCODRAFT_473781 [Baudoinia panamericana UAMH 10762]|uniref:Uncharacterized protein n=1 Tax=Baudoinia panamericana (strain UAMH 10762) TaxID=717646 RepID=M2NB86_BAUPA|nr:uncharacterized protein BAUCODRAFT_473781 [Baudoinia panamericana UAMH 10762]EMC96414.1 hypothetical protein BAUCODRAFT_473781 [Baudoinia panamericana UAMH 10762]